MISNAEWRHRPENGRTHHLWPRSDVPVRFASFLNQRRPMQGRSFIFNCLIRYSAPLSEHVGLSTCLFCHCIIGVQYSGSTSTCVFQSVWLFENPKQKREHASPKPPVRGNATCPPYINPVFLHDQAHKTPSLQKAKTRITMLSQEYQPPIYQIRKHPSRRLKVVLDYLDNVKRWDFGALSNQFTSHFTLQILPASLHFSPRTVCEYIESLHTLRDSLKGAPLEVCLRLDFGFTLVSGEQTAGKDDHISSQRE